ncbi:MAG: YdbH domain-containing protein [Opitutaceae bacterium]|nr:YdbH domain-containing protein [Opitutaceae bacterium]
MRLRMAATGPDEGGSMQWRIEDGELDLGPWWRRLINQAGVGGLPADLALTGVAKLSGGGVWRDGQSQGGLRVEMVDGAASSAMQNWIVPSFRIAAQFARQGEGFVAQSLVLHAAEASVAGVVLRNLSLDAVGDEQGRLVVRAAGVDALGGRIALKPFTVDPLNPEIETTAELAGVALSQLAALVPEALREASGQVSGRVEVKWSATLGPRVGTGALTVTPESPAKFRLAATPGFLTQHAPERISLVPETWGALARWLSFENPAYDTLRRIELGELPLKVEELSVALYPDGPGGPRSAAVRVTARPMAGSVVDQVTFAINIAGPLDQVLRLGASDRVKLKFDSSR